MPHIYLIHAERPIPGSHCQHYLGYTGRKSMRERMEEHHHGKGGVVTREFNRHSIDYRVARSWNKDPWTGGNVTHATEDRFKNRTERWERVIDPITGEIIKQRRKRASLNVKRMCPICRPGNKRGNGAPSTHEQKWKEAEADVEIEQADYDAFDELPF